MALNGYSGITHGYNTVIKSALGIDPNDYKAIAPPIGAIIGWAKTFAAADSGTTDGTTAGKLVQSGQNFETTVKLGYIVKNTTDTTWAYVTAVDSDTTLSLSSDIMISGEDYIIYTTPYLSDAWAECDGSVLSDSDSPFNGATLPDINGTPSFLRGNTTSGTTGGADTMAHTHTTTPNTMGNPYNTGTTNYPAAPTSAGSSAATNDENRPVFYEVVMIMRVK